ncbi:PAS domain-containing protein [Halobaculum sp. MBLA0147]|uniref:PAS domain-containing protein n=1 Tax=Halobaculum sp. MBLA0147 TaxID=3079934 RepID=UPI00352331AE
MRNSTVPVTVLYVDDDETAVTRVRERLSDETTTVRTADGVASALTVVRGDGVEGDTTGTREGDTTRTREGDSEGVTTGHEECDGTRRDGGQRVRPPDGPGEPDGRASHVAAGQIDCVVTAQTLADDSGVTLVERLTTEAPSVPTVLVADDPSPAVERAATEAGASAFVPIRDPDASLDRLARRVRSVAATARERARAERTVERFRQTLDRTTDGVYSVDDDWRIVYVNERMAERIGVDPDESIGVVLWEAFPELVGTELERRYREAMATGEPVAFQTRLQAPVEYEAEIRAFPDEDGLTVFSRDVTDRETRRRELERDEAILRTVDDAVFVLDDAFRVQYANPAAASLVGADEPEAVVGDPVADVVEGRLDPAAAAAFGDAVAGVFDDGGTDPGRGTGDEMRLSFETPDGTRDFDVRLTPFSPDEGEQLVVVARDVTEAAETERRLERTNERLASTVAAAPSPIVEVAPDGTVRSWNRAAESVFGWERDAVVGGPNPLTEAAGGDTVATYFERAFEGERVRAVETRATRRDGGRVDVLLSAAPITTDDGTVESVIAVVTDITERKEFEARLRDLQFVGRELNDSESVAAVGEAAVAAAEEVLDLELTVLRRYDERTDRLLPVAATDRTRELFGELPAFEPGESLAHEAFESGEVRVWTELDETSGTYAEDTALRSEVQVPLGEYGLLSTGTVDRREFSQTEVDLFRLLGASVEAALRRVEREAELRRQNERLDEFASVVAHDLRNPLSVADGYLEVARDTGETEHLEPVADAHDRIGRLIDDLLALARGGAAVEDPEPVSVAALAREAWGYVDTTDATLVVDDGLGEVTGDRSRLARVFENLFRNAVDHSPGAVTVTVAPLSDGRSGFAVADDGPGIDPADRDRVLEHGFSTSEAGTGFGLSIVADTVEAHGWTVSVGESADGGARFEIETESS